MRERRKYVSETVLAVVRREIWYAITLYESGGTELFIKTETKYVFPTRTEASGWVATHHPELRRHIVGSELENLEKGHDTSFVFTPNTLLGHSTLHPREVIIIYKGLGRYTVRVDGKPGKLMRGGRIIRVM